MSDLLAGIDLGSQSAKVVVHDVHGDLVAAAQRSLRPTVSPAPGRVEHPDDDLWDALVAACAAVTADLGERVAEVRAVGLCGIRFCRALLHADGSLAAPVRSWMDARDADDVPPGVAHVVGSAAYLTARLTGRVRDSSAAYALDQAPAGDLVEPGEVLGGLTTAAATATGLPAGLPVVATANDKAVEALGAGLLEPGPVLVSLGTYVAATTVGREKVPPPAPAYWTNPAAVPGRVLHESVGVRRGMWTASWVRDLVGAPDEAELARAAAAVPVGSEGLLTLPDWLAPTQAPWRRGAIVGLDARHGPAHLYRSALEGVVIAVAGHARAMTDVLGLETDDVDEVVVTGGGARSPWVLAAVAACLDRPATTPRAPSAAGLGAAVAAAVGAGLHAGFADAVAAMVRHTPPVRAEGPAVTAYAALAADHRALAVALDGVLRQRRGPI